MFTSRLTDWLRAKHTGHKGTTSYLLRSLRTLMGDRAEDYNRSVTVFCILGLSHFPFIYLFWQTLSSTSHEIKLLRFMGVAFPFILALRHYWPRGLRAWVPLVWMIAMVYCLPFLGTFMFIRHDGSPGWTVNALMHLMWTFFILEGLPSLVVTLLGVGAALGVHLVLGSSFLLSLKCDVIFAVNGICFVVTGLLLVYRQQQLFEQEKLQTMKALGGAIAHEMRTPLMSISVTAQGIEHYLPILVDAHQKASAQQLAVSPLGQRQYQNISQAAASLQKMTRDAQTIIDMLLMKLKDSLSHEAVVQCSVLDCVRKAIAEYPGSENLKDRIILTTEQDFYFAGSERLLVHVLFNLFKNALEASSDSEIYIWTDKKPDDDYHTLHICDTGGGMRSQDKAVLFKAFQSKKRYGTGLGLAFCRLAMRTLNGNIECSTGQGVHTEFVLSFPML